MYNCNNNVNLLDEKCEIIHEVLSCMYKRPRQLIFNKMSHIVVVRKFKKIVTTPVFTKKRGRKKIYIHTPRYLRINIYFYYYNITTPPIILVSVRIISLAFPA